MTKTALLICGMIALLLAGYWWSRNSEFTVDPVLKSIVEQFRGSSGMIEDPTNALGVSGKNDVWYSIDGHEITVFYGKQQFQVDVGEADDTVLSYLSVLGLSLRAREEGDPSLYYMGEEVRRNE